MDPFQISNNSGDIPLNTTNTFILDPTLESELKKLLENKNKIKDIKLDKISFLSKNIQSIGNQIPLIFCNITRLYLSNNNITTLEGIEQFANLTHLSISYNLIEDIYELNRIINPEILLFLNVKGNFFCKNPSFSEVILNLFLNLKSLDDLKINNTHKQQIKYGQDLSKIILPFLLDIHENIEKISNMQNIYQMNNEYNLINSSNNSLQNNNNEKLNILLNEFNNINENSITQILSLINEKKIPNNNNNVIPSLKELNNLINYYLNNSNNNLITSEDNKIKTIYEALFTSLILKQKRKDYRGFLNYLIMTSEQKLLEFIQNKANFLKNIEINKISFNVISQNFEKILINNSDYTMENINEIQMMIFYMYFNGNNILINEDNDIEIVVDEKNGKEKIILNSYEKKVINFREITPNYFPIFPLDIEFMKNLINYIKEKLNVLLKSINEIKKIPINQNYINNYKDDKNNLQNNDDIKDNIENIQNLEKIKYNNEKINKNNKKGKNIDNINLNLNNNKNNDKREDDNYVYNYENNNYNNYNDNNNAINNDNDNDNDNNNNKTNQINENNNYEIKEPIIYNSQNSISNNNNYKLNNNVENNNQNFRQKNENHMYIQENKENIDNYNQTFQNLKNQSPNYINIGQNNEENEIEQNLNKLNKTGPVFEPNISKIQMKYNIIQYIKIINNVIYNHIYRKKIFFYDNLKKIQYLSKIGQIFFTIQTTLYRLQLKLFFQKLQNIKNVSNTIKNNIDNNYFNYPTNKYHYNLKEIKNDNILNQKALIFYYHNLKKKIFMLFKFNFFCYNKKANFYLLNKNNNNKGNNNNEENNNIEIEEENNNIKKENNNEEEINNENNNIQKYLDDDNLLNSNVYKFFHGNEEDSKNKTNDNLSNYNNSINLNDITNKANNDNNNYPIGNDISKNINNDNNYPEENENIKDKNYNDVLQLRKILEEKSEDLNQSNLENKNDINKKESKNEVDELLSHLNKIYKEIDNKCKENNNSKKLRKNKEDNYNNINRNNKNKEYINRLKEIREKEKERAKKKFNKNRKLDENKLLGVPNFLKNTHSSISKNI